MMNEFQRLRYATREAYRERVCARMRRGKENRRLARAFEMAEESRAARALRDWLLVDRRSGRSELIELFDDGVSRSVQMRIDGGRQQRASGRKLLKILMGELRGMRMQRE